MLWCPRATTARLPPRLECQQAFVQSSGRLGLDIPVDWKVYNIAMTKISLQVPEVHCGHCKTSIEGAVARLPGIGAVDVAIAEATVDVEFDESTVNLEEIKKTIEEQGYAVFG